MAATLGDKIKDARLAKHMSITELSVHSGIAKSYISYIERNVRSNPSIDVLERLCAALDLDIGEIVHTELIEVDSDWMTVINEARALGITADKLIEMVKSHAGDQEQ